MSIYRGAGGAGDAVNDSSSEATLVQTLVNSATTQAANAATSATSAQAASTQAVISQGLAQDAATAAALSETNAETAETNAETAQAAAEAAQTAAELAETNAETAETNAETAASSATSSASAASTSATNASNSASAASTSATNASNSASAAATSATNAAASYDEFDDRYLGSKSSNPTVDNDGNALITGALYYNSVVPEMRVYNGSSWTFIGSGASAGVESFNTRTGAVTLTSSDVTTALTYTPLAPAAIGTTVQAYDADLTTLGAGGSSARSFLGLAIGTDVQAYDAQLADIAGLTPTDNSFIVGNGTNFVAEGASTARTSLGVAIGTDVQAYDADTTKNDVANTFTANQVISVTDNSNAALRITQLGTGNALVVEDATNPDSTPFVINASGNAGIGTTSPDALLHVSAADAKIRIGASASSAYLDIFRDNATGYSVYNAAQAAPFRGHIWQLGGTEAMRIDSSANVGIGTINPILKLDVNGIAGWQGGTTGQTAQVVGANSGVNAGGNFRVLSNTTQAVDVGGSITLGGYYNGVAQSADFAQIIGAKANSTAGDAGGYLSFAVRPSGGNATERMRIDSSGRIGIGTTSPTTPLQVNGTITAPLMADSQGGSVAPISSVMRNRIINGAMTIDQRNAGASVTPTATSTYTLDRWTTTLSQPSKFSVQQDAGAVTPPVGFNDYLGVTSLSAYTVGATETFGVRQVIEGYNIADLNWGTANAKTVTVSFWVRSSLTGTFGGALRNSAADRSYPFSYTISATNTWEQKAITVVGETSGTWLTTTGNGITLIFGLGVGADRSGTAGAWAGANYSSATGATSVVGTNGATLYITGVQLEVGTQATGFEYRQHQQELALCQRYYYKEENLTNAITLAGFTASTTTASVFNNFPVTMRIAPTALEQTGTAANYRVVGGGASATTCSAVPAFSSATKNLARTAFTVASGLVIYNGCVGSPASGVTAYLAWSAEL